MAKPFRKLEVLLNGTIYILDRSGAKTLLQQFDGVDAGETFRIMLDDLRKALATETEEPAPENPFDGEAETPAPWEKNTETLNAERSTLNAQVIKNVAKENEEACGDCRIPRCRFCDKPGTRSGGRKDLAGRTVERYYVCETYGCIASKIKTPQPAKLFSGGAE